MCANSIRKKISLVIPIFNEEENIVMLYERLEAIIINWPEYDWEYLFINDGSGDASWSLIKQLSVGNSSIKGVSFSRNFGYQMALTAGHDYAQGDAVITLDADLQDPPELIHEMIRQWQNGYDIVYGKRSSRSDGFIKDITAHYYYIFLSLVSVVAIPRNVGDFRLLDKKVVFVIRQCKEFDRYWRGLVAWTGFTYKMLKFVRPERNAGETSYTWKKLMKLAFDGITSFSLFPLQLAFYASVLVIGSAFLMLLYMVYDISVGTGVYPLYKWLFVCIYLNMGMQFMLLWFVGRYVGSFYSVQKGRPAYIIEDHLQ